MNSKKILMISICVVLLGASAYMLYGVYGPGPAAPAAGGSPTGIPPTGIPATGLPGIAPVPPGSQPASPGNQVVLPYGDKIDFQSIEQYNVNRKKFPYPEVSAGEVGVAVHDLIK
jgi:hypothetical protein